MTEVASTGAVIEVTDENFEAEFPHIQKVIFESAFAGYGYGVYWSGNEIES